jgi:hypothetical protein
MTITLKLLAAAAVMILMEASYAKAGQLLVRGPGGYAHASLKQRYAATRFYVRQPPDLGVVLAGALAGAALQLIPRATEALMARLPPEAPTPPAAPPAVTAQAQASPPAGDVLDDIEGNSRGITRQEVEAALTDWCASHVDAPLCVKLRVTPPARGPTYQPVPHPYYLGHRDPGPRGYYRPGRFQTWNGCQSGWTVQDGLCKPYRGY